VETKLQVPNLIPYAEAAVRLGCSRPLIYKFVREGKLTPLYIGAHPYLQEHQVEALRQERASDGSS